MSDGSLTKKRCLLERLRRDRLFRQFIGTHPDNALSRFLTWACDDVEDRYQMEEVASIGRKLFSALNYKMVTPNYTGFTLLEDRKIEFDGFQMGLSYLNPHFAKEAAFGADSAIKSVFATLQKRVSILSEEEIAMPTLKLYVRILKCIRSRNCMPKKTFFTIMIVTDGSTWFHGDQWCEHTCGL